MPLNTYKSLYTACGKIDQLANSVEDKELRLAIFKISANIQSATDTLMSNAREAIASYSALEFYNCKK